jgi:hypothetical protein
MSGTFSSCNERLPSPKITGVFCQPAVFYEKGVVMNQDMNMGNDDGLYGRGRVVFAGDRRVCRHTNSFAGQNCQRSAPDSPEVRPTCKVVKAQTKP